jgi:flagellar hook assembly protein FlgD
LPENAQDGRIVVYDAGGDMVFFKELGIEETEPGEHIFQWDGTDMFGNLLSRGVYFCGLWISTETEDESKTHKIAIR